MPFTDREVNPFVGTDVTRFDVRFWRKIERQLAAMRDPGMVADLIFEIEWGTLVYRFIDRNRVTDNEWRFVTLFTYGGRAAFDSLTALPIFYRNFDDGRLDGVLALRGSFRADAARLLQASPAGGAAGFATASLGDFTLEASLRTDPSRGTNGAGFVLRARSRDDVTSTSGYYLRYDGVRHLELQRLSSGSPATLATYDDPTSGGVLQPAGWNRLLVTVRGNRIVVTVAGRTLLDATDAASLWPTGYVVFRDGRGLTRIDDLTIQPSN